MRIEGDNERAAPIRQIFSVASLNRAARLVVEADLGVVWVEGEISNLARPASGHAYWTLKDETAQLRCAMFRQRNRQLDFDLRNGQQILVQGRVSIYEARGEFQLVVEHAEPAGEGALRQRFEALKKKLAAEGLFDETRKRALPALPLRIGVITSPSGAAIRDILTVLARRFPATTVLVYPTPVQGDGAAAEIAAALMLADRRRDCDLLILARGGGSLEDLWAFNEEVVARAIAAVSIPIIAGVGHEIDFTIADFVADRRAPTPSGAAELAVPDRQDWHATIEVIRQRVTSVFQRHLAASTRHAEALTHRLYRTHPGIQLQNAGQTLDELEARLRRQVAAMIRDRRATLTALYASLRGATPKARLGRLSDRYAWASRSLGHAIAEQIKASRHRLTAVTRALDAVSPLATLDRGYAIATRADSGRLLTDTRGLAPGTDVSVRLRGGQFEARVTDIGKRGDKTGL